jgi:hypothetical protein
LANAQEIVAEGRRVFVKDPLPLLESKWGDAVVFPADFGDRFLHQCSRSTLGAGDSYWVPETSDIEAAEAIFLKYREQNRPEDEQMQGWPELDKYHRQYVGVRRGDKKMLYANFLPANSIGENDWRQRPLELCDGGPSYFGVEVDVIRSTVVHIDFDGCLCTIVPANKP